MKVEQDVKELSEQQQLQEILLKQKPKVTKTVDDYIEYQPH